MLAHYGLESSSLTRQECEICPVCGPEAEVGEGPG